MKKVVSIIAFLLLFVLQMNNVQAQTKIMVQPLNMVIGIPEMIIISLFSGMAITILVVVFKKVTHK